MKASALARPNLKLIFFGALLLAALTQLLTDGASQSPVVMQAPAQLDHRKLDQYLSTLLERAAKTPDAELYTTISTIYQQKKECRKAMFFLREADRLSDLADN